MHKFIRNWHPISQSSFPFLFLLALWEYCESSVSLTAFGVAKCFNATKRGYLIVVSMCFPVLDDAELWVLCQIYIMKVFSPSLWFDCFFSFMIRAFCVIAKKFSFYQWLQSYIIMNFSRSFINLAFIFKSMCPLELILVCNME